MARKKKTTEQPVVAAEPTITPKDITENSIEATETATAGINVDALEKAADAVLEIGKKALEQKLKADTIPMLFIQHKKSKFATLIPEAEFMAHDEDYRNGWNIVDRAPKAKD